tara:strand:- start:3180 stop:4754 length:1575 start_codon:yes stop_codon:yes gene_type:complete
MDNYNWFPPYITSLLMWEGTNSKKIVNNINENYLGGHKVRVKKIQEIIVKKELINYDISENNHSTLEIFDLSLKKILLFLLTTILPSALNCSAIIIRWNERPKRDTTELYNWSTLALIYVELAGLVCLVSCLIVNVFTIYTNKIIAKYLIVKNRCNVLFKSILLKILILCLFVVFLWLIYFIGDIFIKEYKYFFEKNIFTNFETIVNKTTNETIIIYSDEINSTFGDFDLALYIKLIVFYTLVGMFYALSRLHKFYNRFHMEMCDVHKHEEDHINFYDPGIAENIVYFLNTINGLSMLKILSWFRHESFDFIMSYKHKRDTKRQKIEYRENDNINENSVSDYCVLHKCISNMFSHITLLLTIILHFVFYGSFIGLFIYLGLFNLIYRIKIIEYVGYIEPLKWSQSQWIGFLAFLNNILSLDTGKNKTFKSIFHFLFSGADAKEDSKEELSQKLFKRLLLSYSISEKGIIKTIIVFSQLSHTDIQRICICENSEEEKERIKKHNTELLDLKINNQCEEDTYLDNP